MTAVSSSAATCTIEVMSEIRVVRTGSNGDRFADHSVSCGTYVIVSSATSIVIRNGIVAHITSVIGRWNLTLVMNRLRPTGGCR